MNTVTKYTQDSVFCHTCHEWILPECGIDEDHGATRCTKCGKVSFEAAVLRERRQREFCAKHPNSPLAQVRR